MNKFLLILLLNIILLLCIIFCPYTHRRIIQQRKNKIFNSWDAFGPLFAFESFSYIFYSYFFNNSWRRRRRSLRRKGNFFESKYQYRHICFCCSEIWLNRHSMCIHDAPQKFPVRGSNLFLMNLLPQTMKILKQLFLEKHSMLAFDFWDIFLCRILFFTEIFKIKNKKFQ